MALDPKAIRIWEGNSAQLGATWDGLGVNFSLFSANATKVELCLFDQNGTQEIQRIELPEYTDEIRHAVDPAFTWAHNRRLITWARNPRVGLHSVVRDFSEFADRRECRFRALQRRARSAV